MCRAKEKVWVIILFFCMSILAGCEEQADETIVLEEAAVEEVSEDTEEADKEEGEKRKIYIHVCGQVNIPGVYELEAESRIYEAILAAGGMTGLAAKDYVNQAEILEDGQKVYIPSMEEVELADSRNLGDGVTDASDGRININTAGKEELMTLTGIGEKRADAILAYRQEFGAFKNTEDLMQVEGIKQGTYDKIKDQIKV